MEATVVNEPVVTQESNNPQPEFNKVLGDALWNVPAQPVQPVEPVAPVSTTAPISPVESKPSDTPADPSAPKEEIFDEEEYVKRMFGYGLEETREKWNKYKEYETNPPAPVQQDIQWANDDSKRVFELIKEGKTDEVWAYLDQQRQISRLESLSVSNANEAAEIIKANLRFKHAELKPEHIDRLFERQYTMPKQPQQGEMDDAEYAVELEAWKRDVQQREADMIIDATIAKPELAKYKSNIVLPEIARNEPAAPVVDQKVLDQQSKEFVDGYLAAVRSDYQNFKGYSVTAKDGDVELPISYTVTPDEQNASRHLLENTNVYSFFDSRWFDETGKPKVTQIQEDLYLLSNRDKVFQKIANEASSQRYLHHVKVQNNIKLNTVTGSTPVLGNADTRTDSQKLGEAMWSKR